MDYSLLLAFFRKKEYNEIYNNDDNKINLNEIVEY